MDKENFITNELRQFVVKFPFAKARYEYGKRVHIHVIDIHPASLFYDNADYFDWQCDLFDRFADKYPTENIGFISGDEIIGIGDKMFVIIGREYCDPHIKYKIHPMLDEMRKLIPIKIKIRIDRVFQISDRIHSLMIKHNMTAYHLAKTMGIKESQVNRWINGLPFLSDKTISKLEAVFGERIATKRKQNHSSGRAL